MVHHSNCGESATSFNPSIGTQLLPASRDAISVPQGGPINGTKRLAEELHRDVILGWERLRKASVKELTTPQLDPSWDHDARRPLRHFIQSIREWNTKVSIKFGDPQSVRPQTQTLVSKLLAERDPARGRSSHGRKILLPCRLSNPASDPVPSPTSLALNRGPRTVVDSCLSWVKYDSKKVRHRMLSLYFEDVEGVAEVARSSRGI